MDRLAPRSAWLDLAVLGGALALINVLFNPQDPGWLKLHPSPYFLVPILLGCRYGFGAGLISGLAIAAGIIAVVTKGIPSQVSSLFREQGYLLGAFAFIGGLCGQIQTGFRRQEMRLTAQNENLRERLRSLDGEVALLHEAKADLERLVAIRDAELSTLDSEIRRLFDSEGDELYQDLLMLLSRQARVSDAAVYVVEGKDGLKRKALLGAARELPEQLGAGDVEMVAMCLKEMTPVTLPEFWQKDTAQHRNYLMAVPLPDSHEEILAILVVTGMPFMAMNPKTVQLVTLVCRWAGRVAELQGRAEGAYRLVSGLEGQRLYTEQYFRRSVELAHRSCQLHRLPSSLVLFTFGTGRETDQAVLEKSIVSKVRGGDFASVLPGRVPNVAVLLPLTGERGAGIFVERVLLQGGRDADVGNRLQHKVWTLTGQEDFEEFWKGLAARL